MNTTTISHFNALIKQVATLPQKHQEAVLIQRMNDWLMDEPEALAYELIALIHEEFPLPPRSMVAALEFLEGHIALRELLTP